MNKQKYEALPDDLKAVIDANSGEEFSAFAGKTMHAADEPGHKLAMDRGNNIIELTAEQQQEWQDAAAPIEAWWVEEMNSSGIDGQALLDEAKALIEKNSM